MTSKLLVVHASRIARSVVRRMLRAEAPEFAVDEACDAHEASQLLRDGSYDVVICNETLSDANRQDLLTALRRSGSGAQAGYILMVSEATSSTEKLELMQAGVSAFLQVPFGGEHLAHALRVAKTPRTLRRHRRIHVPGCQAQIKFGGRTVSGDVINISSSGMLLEFDFTPSIGDILSVASLALQFSSEYGSLRVSNIVGRVVRLQVLSCGVDYVARQVRSGWQFIEVPETQRSELEAALAKADQGSEIEPIDSRRFELLS